MDPPLLPLSTSDADTDQAVPTPVGRRVPWRPLSLLVLGSVLLAGACYVGRGAPPSQAAPALQEQGDTLASLLSASEEDEADSTFSDELQQKWMHSMFHGHPFQSGQGLGPQVHATFGREIPHPGGPEPDFHPWQHEGPGEQGPQQHPRGPKHQLPLPGRPFIAPGRGHKCLWQLFHELDTDHDQVLEEPSELRALSKEFRERFNLTADQYELMYDGAGKPENGKIDFESLKQFAGVLYIFRFADKNKDGALSGPELSLEGFALAKELKFLRLPEGTIQKLLEDANQDDDEGLSPAEVKGLLIKVQDFILPEPILGFFLRLDTDQDDVIEDEELPVMHRVLEDQLGIATSFQDEFLKQYGGKDNKLDRRGFKLLIWKAWAGSPFATAGHFKMLIFFRHVDKDRSLFVEEDEMPFLIQAVQKFTTLDNAQLQDLVTKSDENSDNKLTPAEFVHFMRAVKPKMVRPGWGHPHPSHPWPKMKPEWGGEAKLPRPMTGVWPSFDKEREKKWEKGMDDWEDKMDKWQKKVRKELKEGGGDGDGFGEWGKAVDKWQKKVEKELEDKMDGEGKDKWSQRAGLRPRPWGRPWQRGVREDQTPGMDGEEEQKETGRGHDDDEELPELVPVVQRPGPVTTPHAPTAHTLFPLMDTDQDGYVDGPELKPMASRFEYKFHLSEQLYSKLFAAADLNADNKLSAQEFRKFFTALEALGSMSQQAHAGGAQVQSDDGPALAPAGAPW